MQQPPYEQLNDFLVGLFNEILRIEGCSLCTGPLRDLSIREIHVIEAVCQASQGGDSRPSVIAQTLGITAGSLTTAAGTLIKKGYLERKTHTKDKRAALLVPTEKGLRANALHAAFHHDMVSGVMEALQPEELDVLVKALSAIQTYFTGQTPHRKED